MIMTEKRWAQGVALIVKLVWGVLCFVSSGGWAELSEAVMGLGYQFRLFLFLGLFVSLDIQIGLREGEIG